MLLAMRVGSSLEIVFSPLCLSSLSLPFILFLQMLMLFGYWRVAFILTSANIQFFSLPLFFKLIFFLSPVFVSLPFLLMSSRYSFFISLFLSSLAYLTIILYGKFIRHLMHFNCASLQRLASTRINVSSFSFSAGLRQEVYEDTS